MKEKQNKRRLMLLSFLCAFLVWLGVVNVADPVMVDTMEIPVEIVNSSILTKNNLTYEIMGKSTTTVQYEVKTTNAYRIRRGDFRAYADMRDLWSVTGSIPIKVEVLNHGEYLVSNPVSKTGTIKIKTEPLQKKEFTIRTTLVGKMADGYEAGELTLKPERLWVEGPESMIGQISSVGIEINVDGISADMQDTAVPLFYDANGNKIELSDRVKSNCEEVGYEMSVLKVKNVSLDFEVSGKVADGYRFTGVECEVKSVPVIGLKSVLASFHTITIPAEKLDITGARTNMVKTIDLNTYLPEGVSLVGLGRHEVNVTLTVERLEEREYKIEIDDTCYQGDKDKYTYRSDPSEVSVRIRALSEELDSLTLDSSDIVIDVSYMEEGQHPAQPKLNVTLDPAYEVIGISACTVNAVRVHGPEDETETESSAESKDASAESEHAVTSVPETTAAR